MMDQDVDTHSCLESEVQGGERKISAHTNVTLPSMPSTALRPSDRTSKNSPFVARLPSDAPSGTRTASYCQRFNGSSIKGSLSWDVDDNDDSREPRASQYEVCKTGTFAARASRVSKISHSPTFGHIMSSASYVMAACSDKAARFVSMTTGDSKGSNSVEQIRQRRMSQLTEQVVKPDEDETWSSDDENIDKREEEKVVRDVPAVLWLRFMTVVCAVAAFAGTVWQVMVTFNPGICVDESCPRVGLLSDLPLALGSLFTLVSVGMLQPTQVLGECRKLLTNYGEREGFTSRWFQQARQDAVVSVVLWIAAVSVRAHNSSHALLAPDDAMFGFWGALHVASFAVMSGVLMGMTVVLLYICRALGQMVDTFCCQIALQARVYHAVQSWNILQAVLRKASADVELTLAMLSTAAFCAVLLCVSDALFDAGRADGNSELLSLVPGSLVVIGIARVFFCAAAVTDKCARVPSLVNSLSFGDDLDAERQYVVEYIIHSAAGFYVFEVCLTSVMVLKFTYLCGVVVFGLSTKVFTDNG
eukprot:gnl/TRDRNA2_/TRDRNA2_153548_c2_seq1.p1 gnl/TRDRNA2_/TRDRNA2_153548_c2~~gnl/TRDRNA2_/TRDRNA2_153548_c2_seq1.p1  ORF type:complete len:591 (+),score=77.93 gnl/TRDRNA2_/TRDRNA2_153548_c2_seq1:181-1773(+)